MTMRLPLSGALLISLVGAGCAGATSGSATKSPVASAALPAPAAPLPSAQATSEPLWYAEENPRARYIAALGEPSAHDDSVRDDHLRHARLRAAQTLLSFADVELAPADFDRSKLRAESTRRNLLGVFFECGVVRHEVDDRGTHFSVNVTVVDMRTEDIVGSMVGSATAPGPSGTEAEQLALDGALESAMRGVPSLLETLQATLLAER